MSGAEQPQIQGDTLPALLEKGEVSHRYLGRLEVGGCRDEGG